MSIEDNGFTLTTKEDPLFVQVTAGFVVMTGSLADLQDWLREALKEVNDAIEELR